jgi:hypothetical protein
LSTLAGVDVSSRLAFDLAGDRITIAEQAALRPLDHVTDRRVAHVTELILVEHAAAAVRRHEDVEDVVGPLDTLVRDHTADPDVEVQADRSLAIQPVIRVVRAVDPEVPVRHHPGSKRDAWDIPRPVQDVANDGPSTLLHEQRLAVECRDAAVETALHFDDPLRHERILTIHYANVESKSSRERALSGR